MPITEASSSLLDGICRQNNIKATSAGKGAFLGNAALQKPIKVPDALVMNMPWNRRELLERRAQNRPAGDQLSRKYFMDNAKLSAKAGKRSVSREQGVGALRMIAVGDLNYRFAIERGLNAAGIDPRNKADKPIRAFAHRTIRKSVANMQLRPQADVVEQGARSRIDDAQFKQQMQALSHNVDAVTRNIAAIRGIEDAEKFRNGFQAGLEDALQDYLQIGFLEGARAMGSGFAKRNPKPKSGGLSEI